MVEKRASVAMFAFLLICAHVTLFVISPSAKAEEAVTVRVMPESITVELGQPFTVNVTFENITYSGYDGVFGCQFNITWNASILRAVSMQEIAFHTATPLAEWWTIFSPKHGISNGSAFYAYCWMYYDRAIDYGYGPLKGNGSWATITFISLAPGETDLHLSNLEIASTPIILGNGIDGKVSVTNILAGDINRDGAVNSTDAGILVAAFGATPDAANWNSNADINGDNVVDIYDAIILSGEFNQHYP